MIFLYLPLHSKNEGDVAQLVEQRTENPCVGGSIPSITTFRKKKTENNSVFFLFYSNFQLIGSILCFSSISLVLEKCLHPNQPPLLADNGEGCTAFKM